HALHDVVVLADQVGLEELEDAGAQAAQRQDARQQALARERDARGDRATAREANPRLGALAGVDHQRAAAVAAIEVERDVTEWGFGQGPARDWIRLTAQHLLHAAEQLQMT